MGGKSRYSPPANLLHHRKCGGFRTRLYVRPNAPSTQSIEIPKPWISPI